MNFWQKGKVAIANALALDLTHAEVQYGRILERNVTDGVSWLEMGCGRHLVPYHSMPRETQGAMAGRARLLVGVDVDQAIREHPLLHARVFGLGERLPFASRTFDLVSADMVVEHLEAPLAVLREIRRVLKPAGRFVFHTPNYHNYLTFLASLTPDWLKDPIVLFLDNRESQDRFRTYYRLNTATTVRRLATAAGLEVEELHIVGSSGSLGKLWFIGWLECFVLKAQAAMFGGRFRDNLIGVLRRPPEDGSAEQAAAQGRPVSGEGKGAC